MKAKLASLQAGAFSPSRGEPQMEAACSAAQSTSGFWGPWIE